MGVNHQKKDDLTPQPKSEPQESKDSEESETEPQESKDSKYTFNKDIELQGLDAGPKQTPESNPRQSTKRKRTQLPDTKPYYDAPYISREDFNIQDGDFIRYVKEDNIVYQGIIARGKPVENGFDYYHGQDNDYVVKLDFENGKHVAEQKVQQEDRIRIIIAKEQTSFGRNVETVSPSEIIAVSPSYEYDWYKFEDVWDTENDEYNSDT